MIVTLVYADETEPGLSVYYTKKLTSIGEFFSVVFLAVTFELL